MRSKILLPSVFIALVAFNFTGLSELSADTVYLKNGNWIDGTVGHRSKLWLELQVGDLGKMQILIDDIYLIEKNKRTGGAAKNNYIGSEGKKTSPKKEKSKSSGEKAQNEVEPATVTEDESEDDSRYKLKPEEVTDEELEEALKFLGEEEEEISAELKKRIQGLVADLERQKSRYRVRAERQLKAVGRPSIPFLIPILQKKSKTSDLTRIAVMRLFNNFGDDRVIDPCIKSLLDVNEYVRQYANKALIRITGENFGYNPIASPRKREIAQKKWIKWWKQELEEIAKSRRLNSDPSSDDEGEE